MVGPARKGSGWTLLRTRSVRSDLRHQFRHPGLCLAGELRRLRRVKVLGALADLDKADHAHAENGECT